MVANLLVVRAHWQAQLHYGAACRFRSEEDTEPALKRARRHRNLLPQMNASGEPDQAMGPDNATAEYDGLGMQDADTDGGGDGADELALNMVMYKARCFSNSGDTSCAERARSESACLANFYSVCEGGLRGLNSSPDCVAFSCTPCMLRAHAGPRNAAAGPAQSQDQGGGAEGPTQRHARACSEQRCRHIERAREGVHLQQHVHALAGL